MLRIHFVLFVCRSYLQFSLVWLLVITRIWLPFRKRCCGESFNRTRYDGSLQWNRRLHKLKWMHDRERAIALGSRDGAMLWALTSHQCVPGSISRPGVIYGLSLFSAGSLNCSERFFSGYYAFPLSLKTNISEFQFDRIIVKQFIMSSSIGIKFTFTFFYGILA